jgi:hypothetical protein
VKTLTVLCGRCNEPLARVEVGDSGTTTILQAHADRRRMAPRSQPSPGENMRALIGHFPDFNGGLDAAPSTLTARCDHCRKNRPIVRTAIVSALANEKRNIRA